MEPFAGQLLVKQGLHDFRWRGSMAYPLGEISATMPVTDGTTKWMEVVEFLMKALKYPSEFHFMLLVEVVWWEPRSLMDEDKIPMPAPIPLTKPVNWTQFMRTNHLVGTMKNFCVRSCRVLMRKISGGFASCCR